MKKFYIFLLIALLMPICSYAQFDYNKAISTVTRTSSMKRYDDRVVIPQEAFAPTVAQMNQSSITIGAWFRCSSFYNYGQKKGLIFSYSNAEDTTVEPTGFGLTVNSSGLVALCGTNLNGAEGKSATAIELETWNYVAMVVDNTGLTVKVYLNGEPVIESAITSKLLFIADDETNDVHMRFTAGGFGFNGALDEIQLFNKALTADEVKEAAERPLLNDNIVALYTFQEVVEGTTGQFANQVTGKQTSGINAAYHKNTYSVSSTMYGLTGVWVYENEAAPDLTTITEATAREAYVEKYNVTVPADDAVEHGRIEVYNFEELLTAGTHQLRSGSQLTIKGIANEDYTVRSVSVNGVTMDNNSTITLTEDITSISAEIQATADIPVYTVTYKVPAYAGSLAVLNGDAAVNSGDTFLEDTKITVVVTPDDTYQIAAIKINGERVAQTSPYTFKLAADSYITVDFEEKVDIINYKTPSGNKHSNNETYVKSITTEGAAINMSKSYDLCPATAYNLIDDVVEVYPGSTFTLNLVANSLGDYSAQYVRQDLRFTAAHVYEDFDADGVFADANPAQYGDTPPTDNIGGNMDVLNIAHTFTVPEDAPLGTIRRVRVIYQHAWTALNNGANSTNIVDGMAYDIQVKVVPNLIPRNITINCDEAYGSVKFLDPETDAKSLEGHVGVAVVKATPNEGVQFLNWTDGEGTEMSRFNPFAYTEADAIDLTANFGFNLTYTTSGEGGTASVITGGSLISSGTIVKVGTEVTIAVSLESGKAATVTVNGEALELVDHTATFKMLADTHIDIVFGEQTVKLVTEVTGNGELQVWSAYNEADESPAGTQYAAVCNIPLYSNAVCYFKPGKDSSDRYVTFTAYCNDNQLILDEDYWQAAFDENVYIAIIEVSEDLTIVANFSNDDTAIDGIAADGSQSAEYFNLQGMRVGASNLTPGIYLMRQGSTVKKILVK